MVKESRKTTRGCRADDNRDYGRCSFHADDQWTDAFLHTPCMGRAYKDKKASVHSIGQHPKTKKASRPSEKPLVNYSSCSPSQFRDGFVWSCFSKNIMDGCFRCSRMQNENWFFLGTTKGCCPAPPCSARPGPTVRPWTARAPPRLGNVRILDSRKYFCTAISCKACPGTWISHGWGGAGGATAGRGGTGLGGAWRGGTEAGRRRGGAERPWHDLSSATPRMDDSRP